MENIRYPQVEGSFYPKEKKALLKMLEALFTQVETKKEVDNLKILILPHAGYIFSGVVAASGCALLPKYKKPHFVLLGPSHHYFLKGLNTADFQLWRTPLGDIPATPLQETKVVNEVHLPEHSLEVELPFLQYLYSDLTITPVLVGKNPSGYEISALLEVFANSIFIVSSDLSHYLPYKEAKEADSKTIQKILGKEKIDPYSACGAEAINAVTIIAKNLNLKPKLIKYLNSGDTYGDKSGVVGYTAIAFLED